mgnify:CR=1 FL=1
MSKQLKHTDLTTLNRNELGILIQEMSLEFTQRLEKGEDIDTILDEENPFSIFEPFLEPFEFPILVITMINNFQSDTIIDTILDALEKGIKRYNLNK